MANEQGKSGRACEIFSKKIRLRIREPVTALHPLIPDTAKAGPYPPELTLKSIAMKTLSETWFAEGYIDFELKKYTLLAYLQEIDKHFSQQMLYPQLADIIFHYNNIIAFRENKKLMQEQFPKRLSGVQMEKISLLYEQLIADDELMLELESIIAFSEAKMKKAIAEGSEIYEFVENQVNIEPIGLMPLDVNEGYFMLHNGTASDTLVYYYRLNRIEKHSEKYKSIQTRYIDSWERGLTSTFEQIKSELIRTHTELPNPAVYAAETSYRFPLQETLLPVAKRSLVKFIMADAA